MTNATQKSVAITINQNKLLANLEYSFTNKNTLLGEMIQNARRAGATAVNVIYDVESGKLTFADDGKGIADFQNLFSIADSGWEEGVQAAERPFGMGFMSTLYAAEHVRVESNGYFIEGDTKDILAGGVLSVQKAKHQEASTYTEVVLTGFGLTLEQVEERMVTIARGFAIPVFFNGVGLVQDRHLSHAGIRYVEVPGIGHIYSSELNLDRYIYAVDRPSKYLAVYLQGLPMFNNTSVSNTIMSIVHLDPTLYFGRMPDRDALVDSAEAMSKIKAAIDAIHLERLEQLKAKLSPKEFSENQGIVLYALSTEGGHELLRNKDVMFPGYFAGEIDECQPSLYRDHDSTNRETVPAASFSEVESGAVVYCDVEHTEEGDENTNAEWIFARRAGYRFIGFTSGFDMDKHWVAPFIQHLDTGSVKVTVHGIEKEAEIQLDNWYCNMVLCDSYTLSYFNKKTGVTTEITIDDEPLETTEGKFLVPSKVTWIGEDSLMQGSGYYLGEDDLDHATLSADETAINTFLKFQRTGDVKQTLQSVLKQINLSDYPSLAGKKFTISVDDKFKLTLDEVSA